jgi:hypothetical protein
LAWWVKCADRSGYQRTEPHHVGIPPVAQRSSQRPVKALTFYTDRFHSASRDLRVLQTTYGAFVQKIIQEVVTRSAQRNIFVLPEGGTVLRVTRIRAVCGSDVYSRRRRIQIGIRPPRRIDTTTYVVQRTHGTHATAQALNGRLEADKRHSTGTQRSVGG